MTINAKSVIECLNVMYPGKYATVCCEFRSHTNWLGGNLPMETVWVLYVAGVFSNLEFESLDELYKFIKAHYRQIKLQEVV